MRGISVLATAAACLLMLATTFTKADDECLGCVDKIKTAVDYCTVSILLSLTYSADCRVN